MRYHKFGLFFNPLTYQIMEKVIALFNATDMDAKKYRQVMTDLERAGNEHPAGRLSHIAVKKGEGMLVVDVWNSPRQLEEFASVLVPILVKNGVTPPKPEVYPVVQEVLPQRV